MVSCWMKHWSHVEAQMGFVFRGSYYHHLLILSYFVTLFLPPVARPCLSHRVQDQEHDRWGLLGWWLLCSSCSCLKEEATGYIRWMRQVTVYRVIASAFPTKSHQSIIRWQQLSGYDRRTDIFLVHTCPCYIRKQAILLPMDLWI